VRTGFWGSSAESLTLQPRSKTAMEVGLDIFEGIGVVPTFKVALQHLPEYCRIT